MLGSICGWLVVVGRVWLVLDHGRQGKGTLKTLVRREIRRISRSCQLALDHCRILVLRLVVALLWTILPVVARLKTHQATTFPPWPLFATRTMPGVVLISVWPCRTLRAILAGVAKLMAMSTGFLTKDLLHLLCLAMQKPLAILVLDSLDDAVDGRFFLDLTEKLGYDFDQEAKFGNLRSFDL